MLGHLPRGGGFIVAPDGDQQAAVLVIGRVQHLRGVGDVRDEAAHRALIFVINCNLQRLDGPVRGNGKIVQELESDFRGSGWNVVKCLWGSGWDALLAKDKRRQAAGS